MSEDHPVLDTVSVTNLAAVAMGMTSNAYHVAGEIPTLIDVGAGFDIVKHIEDNRQLAPPQQVVLTHTHPDHVGNVDAVKEAYGIDIRGFDASSRYVDTPLADGDHLTIGDHTYEAWYTPGHARDHLSLYGDEPRILFSGDLIFPQGGVGRTDLPGCDHDALIESITRVLQRVDDDLRAMYAGHGPAVKERPFNHVLAAARTVGIDLH